MYRNPDRLDEALELLAGDRWRILSGGTDFYPALGERAATGNILDISKVSGLRAITRTGDGFWSIGALSTWTDVLEADLPAAFDSLKLAAREVGSVQIQNRATVVGNLCNASPAADGVPPLTTLDAVVRLRSRRGERDVPLARFILGNRDTCMQPDEMVTEIRVPEASAQGVSTFVKLGARKYLVISISMVATRLQVDGAGVIEAASVAVGACSAVAKRLDRLERELVGKRLTADMAGAVRGEHLSDLSPLDDVRATGEYRLEASRELVGRTLACLAGEGA